MRKDYLLIHGASDDLIEIDGRIQDEFNIPGEGAVEVRIENHGLVATFAVQVEFDGAWGIAVAGGLEPIPFPVTMAFIPRPDRDEDVAVRFHLTAYDNVSVKLL